MSRANGTGVPIRARAVSRPVPGSGAVRVGTPARCMRDVGTFTMTGGGLTADAELPVSPTRHREDTEMRSKFIFIRDVVALTAVASLPAIPAFPAFADDDDATVQRRRAATRSVGPSCRPTRSPRDHRRARPSRLPTGSRSLARRSRSRDSRRSSTVAGPTRSWRCPTTATAPRPTHGTSSSAPTTSGPHYKTASGGIGRRPRRSVHRVPRSVRRDRLPDRQRGRRRVDC